MNSFYWIPNHPMICSRALFCFEKSLSIKWINKWIYLWIKYRIIRIFMTQKREKKRKWFKSLKEIKHLYILFNSMKIKRGRKTTYCWPSDPRDSPRLSSPSHHCLISFFVSILSIESRPPNMIYNIYIFDTTGSCLYYHEWTREHDPFKSNRSEEIKLIFGLVFSLKQMIKTFTPNPYAHWFVSILGILLSSWPFCAHYEMLWMQRDSFFLFLLLDFYAYSFVYRRQEDGLYCFRTKTYTLYHLDTPSGYRIIVNADNETGDMHEPLWNIYNIFVDTVVKNPLWKVGSEINLPLFTARLSAYISTLC